MKDEEISSIYIIFEFVYTIQKGNEFIDMSCGFCQLSAIQLSTSTSLKLELIEGSPIEKNEILPSHYLTIKKKKSYLEIDIR